MSSPSLKLIEAHFLIYLQFLDDSIDGQSQIGPGDPRVAMAAAEAEGGFAAACSTLAGWFSDMLGEIADECHARTAADVLARLVNSLH